MYHSLNKVRLLECPTRGNSDPLQDSKEWGFILFFLLIIGFYNMWTQAVNTMCFTFSVIYCVGKAEWLVVFKNVTREHNLEKMVQNYYYLIFEVHKVV